jgi:AcrR family transcriptional regulator
MPPIRSEQRLPWPLLDWLASLLEDESAESLAALLTHDAPPDGRMARSHRTREGIVDAMRALHNDGDLRPTAARVAERAGVSLRTVWQHFEDLGAMLVEAGRRDFEIVVNLIELVDPQLPLADRVLAFAGQRARVLEEMTPAWRASRIQEPFSPELQRSKTRMLALARAEMEMAFAPELDRLGPRPRAELAGAVHGVSIWAFWESLRTEVCLDREQARRTVVTAITALMAQAGCGVREDGHP